ncbi:hypothetical protein RclHR1_09450011 [Rhizophagus clarus]|uniref:Uncharacterized protein n=1 Tax=Rhizophagus clarus TaxID=94130 RepID=A0A2Z6SQ95_9GLOM|nr:hypothetical protein RclHR1_09450011 [Rhizophagus clarus]GES95360.1 hypothetical protein RCL_jg9662.t1 [Rhizophagus clarus]
MTLPKRHNQSRSGLARDLPEAPAGHHLRPNLRTSDLAICPSQDKPLHYYCYPKIDDDDHQAVLYCLGSNYLHAGSWISYFNVSNSVALPYPEFRELYFNCLGLNYTRS